MLIGYRPVSYNAQQNTAFKAQIKLGGDMYSVAKKVKEGRLKLEDVVETINKELENPELNPVREGKLEYLQKLLGIKKDNH